MTEDEAKTKWCPHTRQAVAIDCKDWDRICKTMDEETPDWRNNLGWSERTYTMLKATLSRMKS